MTYSLLLIGLIMEAHAVAAEAPGEFEKNIEFEKQTENDRRKIDEMYIPDFGRRYYEKSICYSAGGSHASYGIVYPRVCSGDGH